MRVEAAVGELQTDSVWGALFTSGLVCAVLCLAAAGAAIVAPLAVGAWGTQAVVRRWKKAASLLVLEQKYIKEILRWTQEVAVTHRAVDNWMLVDAAVGTEVVAARGSSSGKAGSGSPGSAKFVCSDVSSSQPSSPAVSSASGVPSSPATALTAEVRRTFVETGLDTGRGLRRATEILLRGVSCRDLFREMRSDVAGELPGDATSGTPAARTVSNGHAHRGEACGKASLSPRAGPDKESDCTLSLANMKDVASQVWLAERDLCAGFQTCLLQLISDAISGPSASLSSWSDSESTALSSSSAKAERDMVLRRKPAGEAADATPELVGVSPLSQTRCRPPLPPSAADESATPFPSVWKRQNARQPRAPASGGAGGTSAVSATNRWSAKRKEVKFDVSADALTAAEAGRPAAALPSLFEELLEAREKDGARNAREGVSGQQLATGNKGSSMGGGRRDGDTTDNEAGVGGRTDGALESVANPETLPENARARGEPIPPSGAAREGAPSTVSASAASAGSVPFCSLLASCASGVGAITNGSRSACPTLEGATFLSPGLPASATVPVSRLPRLVRTAVAAAARTLQALECLASVAVASWQAVVQLVGILFALRIAERELENSTGRLRSALLYDWTRLAATGVRAPRLVLPSLPPASSSVPASSPDCPADGCGKPRGERRGDASAGRTNPAREAPVSVVPCCLDPPPVSPLFRDSSTLLSPGDIRLGLGRLNQHVAAALALLRLGPNAACSRSFRPASSAREADGAEDPGARQALSLAETQLCTKCRGSDSRQAAALLAPDRNAAKMGRAAAFGPMGDRSNGKQTRVDSSAEEADELADAEWVYVLQATQQQLMFARQSCDRALHLFARRRRERDRKKGVENASSKDGGEETDDTANRCPQGEGEKVRQERDRQQEGATGRLALPAPPQELLEIYKGLGEEDGERQRPALDSVPLFNDDLDGAALAKSRLAMGELKRVFMSHPRIQRQRRQRRLVKELVAASPSAAPADQSERGAESGRGVPPGAGDGSEDSEDEAARRLRLELREEEGEEDDREELLDFRNPPETQWVGWRPPANGTSTDDGGEQLQGPEGEEQEADGQRADHSHSSFTQAHAVRWGDADSCAWLARQEGASPLHERPRRPDEPDTAPETYGCLLSGVGLGEVTPESLQLARRLRRQAESAPGARSLFAELSGHLARCGVSPKDGEGGASRARRPELRGGQLDTLGGRPGVSVASGEEGDLATAEVRDVSWGGDRGGVGDFAIQRNSSSASSVRAGDEEDQSVFPPVFGRLARQRGRQTEEAFCGVGEAEGEDENDEWTCESRGDAMGREHAHAQERQGGWRRRASREASEGIEGEERRQDDSGSGGEWEGGSWCLEGRSDGEDESKEFPVEKETEQKTRLAGP
ncbi:conserved hypothetical protein [Neospora caninum Liverpool]|nr:conserved hypothetical protein [Neospora caninum Liverpool]CBZ53058.1 conserved hypothetical protein [Neospora caninum Liverpool]|eukprot:XP_003883090.1 conserved hypothetical protein [Neospora caninum Liverpool]